MNRGQGRDLVQTCFASEQGPSGRHVEYGLSGARGEVGLQDGEGGSWVSESYQWLDSFWQLGLVRSLLFILNKQGQQAGGWGPCPDKTGEPWQ